MIEAVGVALANRVQDDRVALVGAGRTLDEAVEDARRAGTGFLVPGAGRYGISADALDTVEAGYPLDLILIGGVVCTADDAWRLRQRHPEGSGVVVPLRRREAA